MTHIMLDLKPGTNLIITTGDKDCITLEIGARRYMVLHDPKICNEITETGKVILADLVQQMRKQGIGV